MAVPLDVFSIILQWILEIYILSGWTHSQARVSSPIPGLSILITSAPQSANNCVQNGPASTRVISITFADFNGAKTIFDAVMFVI